MKPQRQTVDKNTDKTNSSLMLDKIVCSDGDGFCYYSGRYEATKTKVRLNGKILADDYDALLQKGFFGCGGGFERNEQTGGRQFYAIRAEADKFKVTRKKKRDFTKFRAFIQGERGVYLNKSKSKRQEIDELIQDNSEDGQKIVFNKKQIILEKFEKFLIFKSKEGSLFGLFSDTILDRMGLSCSEMNQKLEENKEIPVAKLMGEILSSRYFTSQYYKNKHKMSKGGLGAKYPPINAVGEALKERFSTLLQEWKENQLEAFGVRPSTLILKFNTKKASFSFEVNNEALKEANSQKIFETRRKNSSLGSSDGNDESTKGRSEPDSDQVPEPKQVKKQPQTPPKMSSYKLFKKKHPFRGPPLEEWFISKPFDLNEAKERKFTTKLVKACYTTQKYELFNRYNSEVHGKSEPIRHSLFKLNFCRNEIQEEILVSKIDPSKRLELGSYHLEFYLDGTLIGVDCIKILKTGVVHSYFFYETSLRPLNLGSIAFLEKAKIIQRHVKFFEKFKYVYLGFYVHNNPKLKYKVKFNPVELRCPVTNTWVCWSPSVARRLDEGAIQLEEEFNPHTQSLDHQCQRKSLAGVAYEFNEDLQGYIAQLQSMQSIYSEVPKKDKKKEKKGKKKKASIVEPEDIIKLRDTRYKRVSGCQQDQEGLRKSLNFYRINALDLFNQFGVHLTRRFIWTIDK